MLTPIGVPIPLLIQAVSFAATHSTTVEVVVREALMSYMEDVRLHLLPDPPAVSARAGFLAERESRR